MSSHDPHKKQARRIRVEGAPSTAIFFADAPIARGAPTLASCRIAHMVRYIHHMYRHRVGYHALGVI